MFCRNCGKDIAENPKVCPNCSSSPIKGTSFCRYCGGPTNEQDVTCPKCEAVLKTTGKAGPGQGWSKKTKQRLIVAAAIIVVVYAIMAMPPRFVVKPVESAWASIVLSTTGYTSNPLRSISANPSDIPVPAWDLVGNNLAHFAAGETQQLAISAAYTKDAS